VTDTGLYKKYQVTKLARPLEEIDAIVLEFKDPIARDGILQWAESMRLAGYTKVHDDVIDKVDRYQQRESVELKDANVI